MPKRQKTKPGHIIKGVLLGEIPLTSGEFVTETNCTEIHHVYKQLLNEENAERELLGKKPFHGMTVNSFVKLMAFARLLGLIEFVREKPFRGHGGPLYRVDKADDVLTAKTVNRRMYRLTEKGREEEVAWSDLTKAYKEA